MREQQTIDALHSLGENMVHLQERVDASNHLRELIVDRLDVGDRKFEKLGEQVTAVQSTLKEMQTTSMTPQELAAIGESAKQRVFWQTHRKNEQAKVHVWGAWGDVVMPLISLAALIVTILVATGHLR